jgi:hypothetical protein
MTLEPFFALAEQIKRLACPSSLWTSSQLRRHRLTPQNNKRRTQQQHYTHLLVLITFGVHFKYKQPFIRHADWPLPH